MNCVRCAVISIPLAFSSCRSVSDSSNETLQGVATLAGVSAMVAVSPAVPVLDVIRRADGKEDRSLYVPAVYRVRPGVYVIPNHTGWFTDRSEFTKEHWWSLSAWVVEIGSARRDKKGRIVLDWSNLDRWYFRDSDHTALEQIPQKRRDRIYPEWFVHEAGDPHFEMTAEGQKVTFILSQEKQAEPSATDNPDNAQR